jgi:general secretion pathway protein N
MSTRGGKLLTMILAGACGVVLLLALTLQFGLGRGYTWLPLEADSAPAVNGGAIDRTPFKLAAETQFAATQERPLFNEDRKPTPDSSDDDDKAVQTPSVPLNISLTGVMLTPQLRVALVQDKLKNSAVALKEGMPMPGDQGGWTLTKINPRSAIFREVSGDEIEVELTTAVANPKPGSAKPGGTPGTPHPQPRVAANPPVAAPNPAASNPAASPAASPNVPGALPVQQQELQRRIEERRKQMRDEAERMKQQPQSQPQQQLQQSQPQRQ